MATRSGPVLVIGATGQQGGAAAYELLERGRTVHAFVRDAGKPAAQALQAAGATLVTGDLDDPASLRAAMAGADGVFLALTMMTGGLQVTADGVAAEVRRGTAVAEIAKQTDIGHLVYSSIRGADSDSGISFVESKGRIEAHIRAVGVPATILRPVSFMDNFATWNRPAPIDGELTLSLGMRPEAQLQMIAARDIGAFAAVAFERPDEFVGRHLDIAGDALTGPEIAETMSRAADVPIRFRQTPIERVRAFDQEVAKMFEWLDAHSGDGAGSAGSPDLAALRAWHPTLMTLETWLRETGWKP
jgi:uncharacterized protein YbjT (DUF2867 family)